MTVQIFSTNLGWDVDRVVYPARAIKVMDIEIQIHDRPYADVLCDLRGLKKIVQKEYRQWMIATRKHNDRVNPMLGDYPNKGEWKNTLYIKLDHTEFPSDRWVPVDHIGVGTAKQYLEFEFACDRAFVTTKGLHRLESYKGYKDYKFFLALREFINVYRKLSRLENV